jgi:two-component system, OmpR family, sensor histidine kinase SenX3
MSLLRFRPRGANALAVLLLLLLAVVLGVLATLQYRWIDRVSEAERKQMRENIEFATRVFAQDLGSTLEPIVLSFEASADLRAAHPELVVAEYLVGRDEEGWFLDDGEKWVPWTGDLEKVHERLKQFASELGSDPPPHMPGPFMADVPALLLVDRRGVERSMIGAGPLPRIVLVLLNRDTLVNIVLPRLAQQHFPRDYDVAILNQNDVLYRSNRAWPDGRTPPDTEVALRPITRRGPPAGPQPMRRMAGSRPRQPEPPVAPFEQWRLLVRRHDGGVDAVVAAARTRNLAVSFGIVLVLGVTVTLLVALLRRAERLREQQLQFVAAISHELNTPVAALRSAGENLRDGIIGDPEKVTRYGVSIVRESTRLGELVGQVLEMAGMQARRRTVHGPVDVATVIADAVAQCDWLIRGTTVRIETDVEKELPPISGDASALTRAVQNLVANAIRHGGSGEWIGVRAVRDEHHVRITVEDRGPGIDAGEAAHLFEPFYRGRNSATVPGAGLGLAIVRQVAVAHGGSVEIERRRGGAAFTIQLPAVVGHV